MRLGHRCIACALLIAIAYCTLVLHAENSSSALPAFGQDTVLVWKIQSFEYSSEFVVRIAEFFPDRLLEWEDEYSQGTIFMPNQDITGAKGFVNSSLFKAGSDSKGKGFTTLWLSRKIYRELKDDRKAKCILDGVTSLLKYKEDDLLTVEVNSVPLRLPVIKVQDDRGAERWFLDKEDNPLMLSHRIRRFEQTLASITTDRRNTLRWIKGKKLQNLQH